MGQNTETIAYVSPWLVIFQGDLPWDTQAGVSVLPLIFSIEASVKML